MRNLTRPSGEQQLTVIRVPSCSVSMASKTSSPVSSPRNPVDSDSSRDDSESEDGYASLSTIRKWMFPIHNHELIRLIPLNIMMFCALFSYSVFRDCKDSIVKQADIRPRHPIPVNDILSQRHQSSKYDVYCKQTGNVGDGPNSYHFTMGSHPRRVTPIHCDHNHSDETVQYCFQRFHFRLRHDQFYCLLPDPCFLFVPLSSHFTSSFPTNPLVHSRELR